MSLIALPIMGEGLGGGLDCHVAALPCKDRIVFVFASEAWQSKINLTPDPSPIGDERKKVLLKAPLHLERGWGEVKDSHVASPPTLKNISFCFSHQIYRICFPIKILK